MAAVTLALLLALERLAASPWRRALRAIREDEEAARSLGKSPERFRLEAFALGGAVMGLAGVVQAHFIGFVAPGNYLPILTFQVWAVLILGGADRPRGAVLGAVVVWGIWAASAAVVEVFAPSGSQARAASLQVALIGVALCAVLLLRPRGLLGVPLRARRGRAPMAADAPREEAP